MFNLAQTSASLAPMFYAFLAGAGAVLLVKIGVLVWAYLKTRKLAPMVYGIYLVAQTVFPLLTARVAGAPQFVFFAGGMWLLEIVLFVWLIYSLTTRTRKTRPLVQESVQDV